MTVDGALSQTAGLIAGAGGVHLLALSGNASQSGGVVAAGTATGAGVLVQAPGGQNDFGLIEIAGASQVGAAGAVGVTCPGCSVPASMTANGAAVLSFAPGSAAAAQASAQSSPSVDLTLLGGTISIDKSLIAGSLTLYSRGDTTEFGVDRRQYARRRRRCDARWPGDFRARRRDHRRSGIRRLGVDRRVPGLDHQPARQRGPDLRNEPGAVAEFLPRRRGLRVDRRLRGRAFGRGCGQCRDGDAGRGRGAFDRGQHQCRNGTLDAAGDLSVPGTIAAGTLASATANGISVNGTIGAGTLVLASSGGLVVGGTITAGTADLAVSGGGLTLLDGAVVSAGAMTLDAQSDIVEQGGLISAKGTLAVVSRAARSIWAARATRLRA